VLEWVGGLNHRRFLELIGMIPPAEHEAAYSRQPITAEALNVSLVSLR